MKYLLFFSLAVFVWGNALPVEAVVTCPDNFSPSLAGVCIPSDTGLSDIPVADLLATVLEWLLSIASVIGIIAFVISGFQYLTAAGDEDQAKTAKRNIQYAIIGIVVAVSGLIVITAIDSLFNGNPAF